MSIDKQITDLEQRAADVLVPDLDALRWDLSKLTEAELHLLRSLAVKAGVRGGKAQAFDFDVFAKELDAVRREVDAARGIKPLDYDQYRRDFEKFARETHEH